MLEIHGGGNAVALDLAGGAILDFADVTGAASATLSDSELQVRVAGHVVAEVGLTATTAAAFKGPLTLLPDGNGGSELILGNDTIHPGRGADTPLGAAGEDRFVAGSGDGTIIGGGMLFRADSRDTFAGGSRAATTASGPPVFGVSAAHTVPGSLAGYDATAPAHAACGAAILHLGDGTTITFKGFTQQLGT